MFEDVFQTMKKQNEMVYYDKMPAEAEALPEPKSTIEVAEYTPPETNKNWNPEVYSSLKAKSDGVASSSEGGAGACCCVM